MTVEFVRVIDSHTGGEPTRTVISGGPDLGTGSLAERRRRFEAEHDRFRSALCNEPRGSEIVVGALLVPPDEPNCTAGVLFFNNVGSLWMCGHGLIGVVATLGWLGRIAPGTHRFDTPVGVVEAEYLGGAAVRIRNVPSRRSAKDVRVDVEGFGEVVGDVAWGGNWFYLIGSSPMSLAIENADRLVEFAWAVRRALAKHNVAGDDGGEIDHVEVFGPPQDSRNRSRNFVLCPGKAYDRSPCGTGTSAKIACLAADGKLAPGEIWRQESICGSVFEATYERVDDLVIPIVSGAAFVIADGALVIDPADPFRYGLR
jgi:4-hydroxyproline epimerase